MKNKKGSILDVMILAISLFVLSMFIILGNTIFTSVNTDFQKTSDLSNTSRTHIGDLKNKYVGLWDNIFFMVMILFAIAIGIGAYFLDLHPIFYLPSIFIIIITILISGVLENAFIEVTDQSEISGTSTDFNLMIYIMDNFPMMILVLSFLIIIILYAKNKAVEGY